MRIQTPLHLLALLPLVGLAACGGSEPEVAPPEEQDTRTGMPAALWSDTPLEGAKDVIEIRESASDGDEVVVRGTLQDFGDLATFRLVEDTLKDCTEMPDDVCPTPWDYCCADPEKLALYTVNVEFLEDGLPAEWSLRGEHGLDNLSEVTVAGTLRVDEAGNLRIEAKRMALQ